DGHEHPGVHSGARPVPALPAAVYRRPHRGRRQGLIRLAFRAATYAVKRRNAAMLTTGKAILDIANEHNFAVPAFNISDYAMFTGIVDISEEKDAPLILGI